MKYLIFIIIYALCAPTEDLVDQQVFRDFKIPYAGKMYSGYLPIQEGKDFHYFFFPAYDLAGDSLKATIPLILWLNGGPGCSSLFGALNENGPFVFNLGTNTLRKNEWSWTNFAHMFYLESPAGVGFSTGDYHTSDAQSAQDNLKAVIEFFNKFPEYSSTDFYIAGESYAGTYIPNLASLIIDHNQQQGSNIINLKGVMIGNGCTDPTECTIEAKRFPFHKFEFLFDHNMISDTLWDEISANRERCIYSEEQFCKDLYARTAAETHGNSEYYFNPYNVYGECYTLPTKKFNGDIIPKAKGGFMNPFERQPGTVPECSEAQGLYYLFTNPQFLQGINIRAGSQEWLDCNDEIYATYQKDPRATFYLYPKLIMNGIRILKFSGDVDGVVPITGTLYWLDRLQNEYHIPTIENWRPWYMNGEKKGEDQNAGNVWILDGLWFVSVRNAGHMVPMDQPQASSIMISYFIYNIPLPIEIP